MGNSCRCNCVG